MAKAAEEFEVPASSSMLPLFRENYLTRRFLLNILSSTSNIKINTYNSQIEDSSSLVQIQQMVFITNCQVCLMAGWQRDIADYRPMIPIDQKQE
jgi:hypothetical protein